MRAVLNCPPRSLAALIRLRCCYNFGQLHSHQTSKCKEYSEAARLCKLEPKEIVWTRICKSCTPRTGSKMITFRARTVCKLRWSISENLERTACCFNKTQNRLWNPTSRMQRGKTRTGTGRTMSHGVIWAMSHRLEMEWELSQTSFPDRTNRTYSQLQAQSSLVTESLTSTKPPGVKPVQHRAFIPLLRWYLPEF
ncbi:hypothetical protein BDP27DRAFT_39427 [Rhodocollybia butyracea]|uniref:Uncharacterized protein n=1 Tax=Rhodocollybia butyracea TaxID=206335 RepID=A0A9P5Q6X8_9AGAR|nr:hypothetical protein BDP27DRAFT_39427 [Rhodocollybia butyracea]